MTLDVIRVQRDARWAMVEPAVEIRQDGDGYVVTCPGTGAVGRGPTETQAWTDFWDALHADWKPPEELRAGLGEDHVRGLRVLRLFL
ncbi:hypothetical protein PV703_22160 [Streptomyces sp. ME01-24h]|nr:hypothetical protein [Streptomyces sp. ME01-24h]